MFDQWIQYCRERLEKSRSSIWRKLGLMGFDSDLVQDNSDVEYFRKYYWGLLKYGHLVWGGIAQANSVVFQPGDRDTFGDIIYSTEAYFDNHPNHLLTIAHRLYSCKWMTSDDPELAAVAERMSDEYGSPDREPLPLCMTDGHSVLHSIIAIHRSHL